MNEMASLVAGREHDRVDDRHDAAFGLRKRQAVVRANHALHDAGIREGGTAVAHIGHRAVSTNYETNRDASLQVRIVAQAVLVAETESSVVLANDALNDLGRKPTVDGGGSHPDLRSAGRVRTTQTPVA